MRKKGKAIALWVCAVVLLGMFQMSATHDVVITAVNDTLKPLESATMPVKKAGEWYVPYTLLTGGLGVHGAYNAEQKELLLYNWDNTLHFDLAKGYVQDEFDNTYWKKAYEINKTIYIPVKWTAQMFSLHFSVIPWEDTVILRLSNADVQVADKDFGSRHASKIEQMMERFLHPPKKEHSPSTQDAPQSETLASSSVYLAFYGMANESTTELLQSLQAHAQRATFFFSVDNVPAQLEWMQQCIVQGHGIGLALPKTVLEQEDFQPKFQKATLEYALLTGLPILQLYLPQQVDNANTKWLTEQGYTLWNTKFSYSIQQYRWKQIEQVARDSAPALMAFPLPSNGKTRGLLSDFKKYAVHSLPLEIPPDIPPKTQ